MVIDRLEGKYHSILAATKGVPVRHLSMDSAEIIDLPSGKKAIGSRPSLKGLRKFSDIEKVRAEQTEQEHNERRTESRDIKRIAKWGIGIIVIGCIGGLGYCYIDRIRSKTKGSAST